MTIIKLVNLALRNLLRNSRRTFITVLVSAAGFAALAVFAGYMDFSFFGLRELTICRGFATGGGTGHVQVFRQDALEKEEAYALQFGIADKEILLKDIEAMEHVAFAMPRIEFNGLVSNGDKSISFMGLGVDPAGEAGLIHYWNSLKTVGSRKQMSDAAYQQLEEAGPYGVLLGEEMSNVLQAQQGDNLMLMSTTVDGAVNVVDVTVAGVIQGAMSALDAHYLVTSIDAAGSLLQSDKVSKLVVVLDETDMTESGAQNIDRVINGGSGEGLFAVVTWDQLAEYYDSVRDIYTIIFGFTGGIVVTIVFLGCVNTMLMSTMERVREIGTLKAIGVSNGWIAQMFLFEGFFIGILSILAGIVLQHAFLIIINHSGIMMPPPPGMSSSYQLRIFPAPGYLPWIALLIVMSTTFSGLLTLQKIRKLSIVDSLSHA